MITVGRSRGTKLCIDTAALRGWVPRSSTAPQLWAGAPMSWLAVLLAGLPHSGAAEGPQARAGCCRCSAHDRRGLPLQRPAGTEAVLPEKKLTEGDRHSVSCHCSHCLQGGAGYEHGARCRESGLQCIACCYKLLSRQAAGDPLFTNS